MRTISDKELRKIVEKHGKFLRGEEGGKRAYLRGADLRGAHLGLALLSDADLYRADLSGANLTGADLAGADPTWARLDGTKREEKNV